MKREETNSMTLSQINRWGCEIRAIQVSLLYSKRLARWSTISFLTAKESAPCQRSKSSSGDKGIQPSQMAKKKETGKAKRAYVEGKKWEPTERYFSSSVMALKTVKGTDRRLVWFPSWFPFSSLLFSFSFDRFFLSRKSPSEKHV